MGEQEPFEKIRHRDENGKEYWKARELATALGYSDYRNFKAVMEKAKALCLQNGHQPEDHFVDFTEMAELGSGSKRSIADFLVFLCCCQKINVLNCHVRQIFEIGDLNEYSVFQKTWITATFHVLIGTI